MFGKSAKAHSKPKYEGISEFQSLTSNQFLKLGRKVNVFSSEKKRGKRDDNTENLE